MNAVATPARLEPVQHTVRVALEPTEAFALFTSGLARWWPLATHSCSGQTDATVRFGAGVGEPVVELARDGTAHLWGKLTHWDPPHGFGMTWHPGSDAAQATQLDVKFEADEGGCRITVHHGGWEARGDEAAKMRGNYDGGWVFVLRRFADAAAGG